jgi:hypothetical protein
MNNESTEKKIDEITSELKNIERRKQELTEELRALKSPTQVSKEGVTFLGTPAREQIPKTPQEKVSLFLDLFRCRHDVYPNYWEKRQSRLMGTLLHARMNGYLKSV